MDHLNLELAEEEFCLLALGGLWWKRMNALVVADLHLGKAPKQSQALTIKNQSGPPGTYPTIARLEQMLDATQAGKLWILGDLFESRSPSATQSLPLLQGFLESRPSINTVLVLGNHDQQCRRLLKACRIEQTVESCHVGEIRLLHVCDGLFADHIRSDFRFTIAGHQHPARRCSHTQETRPCFWWSEGWLILPALGEHVISHTIPESPHTHNWLTCY